MSGLASLTKAQLIALIEQAPAAPVKASTFRTRAQIAAGDGYPCTVSPTTCKFIGRTPARAAVHGIEKGGHAFRKA
jgi:hypothetical protein